MKIQTLALLFLIAFSLIIPSIFMMSPSHVLQERKRIAFDETHMEVHTITDGYAQFYESLKLSGFEVEPIREGPLTLHKLRAYSVLVLPLSRKPFSNEEISAITSFVEGSGGLFIIGDCGGDELWGSNINNLSSIFGITFNPDVIKAPIEPVKINRFKQHPITVGIKQIVCRTGSSLNVAFDAFGLASASSEAWADRLTGQIGVLEQGEARGENVTILAVSNFGLGKVVCLGSSTLFIDSNLLNDHKKLGLNILNWLSSSEPLRASIENGLIRLKFFDDNLHSSYQVDVWDETEKKWITAYHDIRFYTTSIEGFNFTWNIGGTSVETRTINERQVLIVKYPKISQYGYKSKIIDIGLEGDEANLYGEGWSEPFIFNNRTVRKALPGREDIHLTLDYSDYPWFQYNISLTYADVGMGRVDINALTWKGWTTIESFHVNGTNKWAEISTCFNVSDFYVESETNKMRLGIHVEGDPFIIDKVGISTTARSESIEILAFLSNDSPLVSFFMHKFGDLHLNGVGVIGELTTKSVHGKRFAFSSLLVDALSEKDNKMQISQGSCRNVLNLGTDEAFSAGPSPGKSMYIYGDGWSEVFAPRQGFKAREAIAEKTNTFLVIPAPPSLKVLYNLSISYLDLTELPVDVNLFNGSDWISVGHIKRENTGTWRTTMFSIPPSEMYFDPVVGGMKVGLYAYGSSLVVSKIAAEWKTIDDSRMATAFSCGQDKVVNFIFMPKVDDQIFQHEVDGINRVVKTIDIFTPLSPLNINKNEEKLLPIAAVGSYVLDTSSLLMEAENLMSEGWRPRSVEFSNIFTQNLDVAMMNASSMHFNFSVQKTSTYSVVVRYLDIGEGVSSKKVIVSLNGHEIGRIKFEGSGTFQLWREEVELAAGTNTLTLNPISNTPTSDIAFIDYVLIAPKFWEEEAACELESLYNNLASDGDGL
jgi:hypothetical protein